MTACSAGLCCSPRIGVCTNSWGSVPQKSRCEKLCALTVHKLSASPSCGYPVSDRPVIMIPLKRVHCIPDGIRLLERPQPTCSPLSGSHQLKFQFSCQLRFVSSSSWWRMNTPPSFRRWLTAMVSPVLRPAGLDITPIQVVAFRHVEMWAMTNLRPDALLLPFRVLPDGRVSKVSTQIAVPAKSLLK